MGRNKDSGLDSMTSPLSWVSGLVNKGSCDRGPGWPLGRVGEAGKAACLNAGLHPSFSPGASAFSRYLIQGKTRTGNHVAMETRHYLTSSLYEISVTFLFKRVGQRRKCIWLTYLSKLWSMMW